MLDNQLDFVAVGPFKTGTSWIYNYLINYQQVALPTKVKETFFFDHKFERGIDWYFSHFEEISPEQKIGEIAPSYFHSESAPQRIFQHNPQCKIIVTLREPISRLISFYQHKQQRGELKPKTSLIQELSQKETLYKSALYHLHLSRWIDVFGADKVQVIFFEDLATSPVDFAKQLCQKIELELENTSQDLSQKVNASEAPVNHYLSKIVYQSVNLLHNTGLHQIVKYGKSLGIKQLLNSKKSAKLELETTEYTDAFEFIKQDIMKLETELNFDLSNWRELWLEQGINPD
ncbi:MAG: sulfotransferase domain-containing protein [Cyanobacteria bacterium J06621_8]